MSKIVSKTISKKCPLCQDPSGTGSFSKTYYPKTICMGGCVGTWLSKNYRLTGNKLTVTVDAIHQSESDIYYDTDDFENPSISMKFNITTCPVCRRKIDTIK